MRVGVRLLLAVILLAVLAGSADAQRRRARGRAAPVTARPHFGGHLGYNFDTDGLLVGAQLTYPITPRVDLYPSFDFYAIDPGTLWALNVDAKFRPPSRFGAFYLGGGINYSRRSVSGNGVSDTNLNLFTGLEGRRQRVWPYVEAKLILGDGSAFQILGGLSWRM